MATYVPPKKGVALILYIGLVGQANPYIFQVNPTLAAGDFKVSIDGGALANLATLPTVTPAASKMVKISLDTSEMNGDNVTVVCSDAAGAEWVDQIINIQTAARQIDDLAFPNTSGRGIDVSAGGEVGLDWANIGSPTTAQNLSGTNIDPDQVVASVAGAVGSVTGGVGGNVSGSVASVTAPVTVGTNSDKTGYATTTADKEGAADALLGRNIGGGSNGGRTVQQALRLLRNLRQIVAGVLTVFQEDDTTPDWTANVTTTAGNPITKIDP